MNWHSFQVRFYASLVAIGVITAVVTTTKMSNAKRELAESLIEQSLWQASENYFDSINTLMISGLMANRKILQEKMISHDEIVSARVIRSQLVSDLFGPGFSDQTVQDKIDERALSGEKFSILTEKNGVREMTVLLPIYASNDYAGTNCLNCHATAKEGDVLGAIRITSSLAAVDARITRKVWNSAIWQLAILIVGFLLLWLFTRQTIVKGLSHLKTDLRRLAHDLDFSVKFPSDRKDEIGYVYSSLQNLVEAVHQSLLTVVTSSKDVLSVSKKVKSGADETEEAVSEQKLGTDSVATAVDEMDASASEVRDRTKVASDKSNTASALTQEGIALSDETQRGLQILLTDVNHSADVIHRLDDKTQSVNSILETISGIAEQTNLLALNAAIEAARAGEQGRGFAVVADEVRTLATRTRESTAEIQSTLNALQEEARNAVDSMSRSSKQAEKQSHEVKLLAEKLKDVAMHVEEMNDLNFQIAQATEQQNETAEEINRNTSKIREVADHSESVALSSKSYSRELVTLAEQLADSIQRFKL